MGYIRSNVMHSTEIMILILMSTILHIITRPVVVSKAIGKRSDIINGRGFAAPPKLNIEEQKSENYLLPQHGNYPTSYQQLNENSFIDHYSDLHSRSSANSEYDSLNQRMINDKLRAYIGTLKQQLKSYISLDDQNDGQHKKLTNWNDYGRHTAVELPNHHYQTSRKKISNQDDTKLWFKNENQPKTNIQQAPFPSQEVGDDAII